jgi:hypothetical protein
MLEAFQASSHETPPESDGASQETKSASTVSRRAKSGLPDVAPEVFAVTFSVLIIGAFFLGRWSASGAVQAASETSPAPVEVTTTPALVHDIEELPALTSDPVEDEASAIEPVSEPASMSLMEQHTRDFTDKANTVTLRVIYYGDDEQGQRRAYQTALHLEEMGFPVVNPIVKGGYVYVCVGAAPSKNDPDLMRYQRELQLVPGPKPYGKPGDYASAFPYNIDKLITR